jgi:hypothetical protein
MITYTQQQAGFSSTIDEEIVHVKMKPQTYAIINQLFSDRVVEGKEEVILADTAAKSVKRSDWKNSRKAINDILQELIGGKISEQRARLELDSIGIPPAKIDAYIEDTRDGQIDNTEAGADV